MKGVTDLEIGQLVGPSQINYWLETAAFSRHIEICKSKPADEKFIKFLKELPVRYFVVTLGNFGTVDHFKEILQSRNDQLSAPAQLLGVD